MQQYQRLLVTSPSLDAQFELTPEMIGAGAEVLLEHFEHLHASDDASDIAEEIFRAMIARTGRSASVTF